MTKKTDKVYSLMNVFNGNILTASLHSVPWRTKVAFEKSKESILHTRKRNWKLSQFNINREMLDNFINDTKIDNSWTMGVHKIWVKEDQIDELYTALAWATLNNYCNWEKQTALFGAFIFHLDANLFIEYESFKAPANNEKYLKDHKLGKQFLTFLEEFGVLSYSQGSYNLVNGTWQRVKEKRSPFCMAELELVSREIKDVNVVFECEIAVKK